MDVLMHGNFYNTEIEITRHDAGNGLLLLGKGDGTFTPMRLSKPALRAMVMQKDPSGSVSMQNPKHRFIWSLTAMVRWTGYKPIEAWLWSNYFHRCLCHHHHERRQEKQSFMLAAATPARVPNISGHTKHRPIDVYNYKGESTRISGGTPWSDHSSRNIKSRWRMLPA